MFSKHVSKDLSAYCHGELAPEQAQQFAEHLIACSRCRAELEEIKLGIKFAEQLPRFSAPASMWSELEQLKAQGRADKAVRFRSPARFLQPQLVAIGVVLLVVLGLGLFLLSRNLSKPSWEVARLHGNPRIGSTAIGNKGRLAVGQWLETDSTSRAKIEVGSIGNVEIDPNTRVRLLETRPTEHRLELAKGRMSAR